MSFVPAVGPTHVMMKVGAIAALVAMPPAAAVETAIAAADRASNDADSAEMAAQTALTAVSQNEARLTSAEASVASLTASVASVEQKNAEIEAENDALKIDFANAIFLLQQQVEVLSGGSTLLRPGPSYDGNPGSGFAGSLPVDPPRITAKPAAHLLMPPNQHFTSTLPIGVIAAANNKGTFGHTLGIASVEFLYEGGSITISAPTLRQIETQKGSRTYFGWWCDLQKVIGLVGTGHLYVRVNPLDLELQSRVLGPFKFTMADKPYDYEYDLAPSQPVIEGSRYQDFNAAATHARENNAQNPLFRLTEPGTYDWDESIPNQNAYDITGFYNITATQPGTVIGRATYTGDENAQLNNLRTRFRIFGPNLTIDRSNLTQIGAASLEGDGGRHWLDGITITTLDPAGKNKLFRGTAVNQQGAFINGDPYFTECTISRILVPAQSATLTRGCTIEDVAADVVSGSKCVVFTTCNGQDQDFWNSNALAITVQYTGAETVATLARSGGNNNSPKGGEPGGIFTAVIGAITYTFDVGQSADQDYWPGDLTTGGVPPGGFRGADAVGGYTVQDVADWLNSLPDVTATVPNAEIGARYATLGLDKKNQGFDGQDIKAAPLELGWAIDTHGDWYQIAGGSVENTIHAFNRIWDCDLAQIYWLSPVNSEYLRDMMFFGNALAIKDVSSARSALGRSTEISHVCFVHDTLANQGFEITSDITGGAYCLFKNVSFKSLYGAGLALPGVTIDGLHIWEGEVAPAEATRVIVGGDSSTLYADINTGNYAPQPPLTAQGFEPAAPIDMFQAPFPDPAAPGGLAADVDALYVAPPPPPPPPPPSDDKQAVIDALDGKAGSGAYDMRDGVPGASLSIPIIAGGATAFVQGNADRQPTISETDGAVYTAADQLDAAVGAGVHSVFLLMRKDAGSTTGQILRNLAIYTDGSSTGYPSNTGLITVDTIETPLRRDIYNALNDDAWHIVQVDADLGSQFRIGREGSALQGAVMLAVSLAHADFTAPELIAAEAAVRAWMTGEIPAQT